MGELAQSMAADGQADKKVGEDEDAEDQIQLFYGLAGRPLAGGQFRSRCREPPSRRYTRGAANAA